MGSVQEGAAEEPTWQVARGDSMPLELEHDMLHTLDRHALVWTDGLPDWLPLGDVPPLDAMPPLPRAIGDISPTPSPTASRKASLIPS